MNPLDTYRKKVITYGLAHGLNYWQIGSILGINAPRVHSLTVRLEITPKKLKELSFQKVATYAKRYEPETN